MEVVGGGGLGEDYLIKLLVWLLWRRADVGGCGGVLVRVGSVVDRGGSSRHVPLLRELVGVAHQVEQRLPKPDRDRRASCRGSWQLDLEPVLVLLASGARWSSPPRRSAEPAQRLRVELQLPGLDLGEVEHVVDQAEQVPGGAQHRSQRFERLVRGDSASSRSISVTPMMALSGVRSSWLMLARNCDLCWLASASWRLLSWISSNSRTFSIAITAWSAKVVASSICLSVKRRTTWRSARSRRSGSLRAATARRAWHASRCFCGITLYSGSAERREHERSRFQQDSPSDRSSTRVNRIGFHVVARCPAEPKACGMRRPPSDAMNAAISASHKHAADSTSVSSTACRSKVERLMTLSTSAVAVCCCSDSRSSLSRRVFSMAMTAWLAKF